MSIDFYIPPIIIAILLSIGILKWLNTVFLKLDYRGISAVCVRMYLLYGYIIIIRNPEMPLEYRALMVRIGLMLLLFDESIFWISTKIVKPIEKINVFLGRIYGKLRNNWSSYRSTGLFNVRNRKHNPKSKKR